MPAKKSKKQIAVNPMTIVFGKFKTRIDGVTKSNKRDRSLKDIEMFVGRLHMCVES